MPFGYTGKILRVDLGTKRLDVETHDDAFYRTYVGGRALVAYYLLREVPPGADPFGPDNVLVFAPGVLTGASVSGQGRNGVGAKSPLTGAFGNAEGGGFWGSELKRAGFDAVVVRGVADHPVYLWVHDGQAELCDARHLWGKTTGQAEDLIRDELGDRGIRTCLIGPAGENRVRFAAVVNDRSHFAGRTGLGAVMGAKNLKGIAARATGLGLMQLKDPAAVKAVATWMARNLDLVAGLHDTGTAGGLKALSVAGGLPTCNFLAGHFDGDDRISGQTMRDTILVKRDTCAACAVRCKRVVQVKEPLEVDPLYGGPEYESLAAMGSMNGVDDLVALAKANELAAAWGLDTISAGASIAWAMECYERGILTREDTGGLELRWGDARLLLQLLEMITWRRGFGDLLAEGAWRASRRVGRGSEEYALHVKGQELPMHEPRIKHALGVGYAVSPTGADHMHNFHDTVFTREGRALQHLRTWDPNLQPVEAHHIPETKLELFYYQTNWRHFLDCAVMCHFLPYEPAQLVQLVNGCTGWDTDAWELLRVGERAATLARAVNAREGYAADADTLPKRFFKGYERGESRKGMPVDPAEFEAAKRWYYRRMGWDPETGIPTRQRLAALGVGWVADALADGAAAD